MAALLDLRMPGVYTQEIPTLPPSVAVIPTAVPLFIGYTEKAIKNGKDVTLSPTRIRSLREYESWFGTAPEQRFEVDVDDQTSIGGRLEVTVIPVAPITLKMHYALQLYFTNGGGPCYIISVGDFASSDLKGDLESGIRSAVKAKEGTIIVMPDAVNLTGADYGGIISAALMHCEKMKNRVTIIDVHDTNGEDDEAITTNFRTHMISDINFKKYGAAYYPYLETTLDHRFSDETVSVRFHMENGTMKKSSKDVYDSYNKFDLAAKDLKSKTTTFAPIDAIKKAVDQAITADSAITVVDLKKAVVSSYEASSGKTNLPEDIEKAFLPANDTAAKVQTAINASHKKFEDAKNAANATFTTAQTAYDTAKASAVANAPTNMQSGDYSFSTSDKIKESNNLLYTRLITAVRDFPLTLPPSAAIAGVYVRTDFTQGVWKAPANTSLVNVIRPTVEIDDDLHANLNVTTSGKSVNAIRTYQGKGILVFGARTLAGNDNEWRYISVRRTFCFIEDSIARAMEDFVFAPNIRDTWIKVKATISNFLNGIWKAGGLFGDTPDEAYSVSVGLPETMSDLDILEGRMIVEIKLRVSRPAEFIILRYEHKFNITNA